MSLLQIIRIALEKITPRASAIASAIASIASVMASVSWLLNQAKNFVCSHNGVPI